MGDSDFVIRGEFREAMAEQLRAFSKVVTDQSAESRHLMQVLVGRVESRVETIGEGHQIQVAKLDRLTQVVEGHTQKLDDLGAAVLALRGDVSDLRTGQDDLRGDMSREFKELRAHISLSYAEIDGRLRFLEHEVGDLRARLEQLEARTPA